MNQATLFLEVQRFVCQGHSKSRQKSEIVAERESGALTGTFAHLAAKTAINCAITFRVAQAQFRCVGSNVTYHRLTPLKSLPSFIYHNAFVCKLQEYFVFFCETFSNCCYFCREENKKISKKCKKAIDKWGKKVYNTIENKAGLSALTYLQ